jgi:hypothetical protein
MNQTRPLPKWAMTRYAALWNRFKDREFGYASAAETLQEQNINMVSMLISYLNRHSCITIQLDQNDTRKRIYKLKAPGTAVEQIAKIQNNE